MCLSGSAPKDDSGDIAAQQEATREANITQGQSNIDSAFGQFNDDYYNNIQNEYENYYNPQLNQQYTTALNSLTYQLAQQGILNSSEAARQEGLFADQNTKEQQSIADQAVAASNSAKQEVANEKNTLYAQNQTAADPSLAASQAAEGAASAVSPITYSPLASVFSGLLGQGTNALAVQNGALPGTATGAATTFPAFATTAGISGQSSGSSGSDTVVGK